MSSDILQDTAMAFRSLLQCKYHIVLGRKGKTEQIDICFMPDVFFHLAGLHYLEKSYFFSSFSSEKIFSLIADGKISLSHIQDDCSFSSIFDRLVVLKDLECIMDASESEFFKYEKRKTKNNSKIEANYLAKSILSGKTQSFVFFLREKGENFYITNSIFPMESYDYSQGQVKYSLLFKEKIKLRENTSQILFHHKKYMPEENI